MKYNSRGFLGFSVDHKTENPDKSVRQMIFEKQS